jgi:hypothetical protein
MYVSISYSSIALAAGSSLMPYRPPLRIVIAVTN